MLKLAYSASASSNLAAHGTRPESSSGNRDERRFPGSHIFGGDVTLKYPCIYPISIRWSVAPVVRVGGALALSESTRSTVMPSSASSPTRGRKERQSSLRSLLRISQ